MKTATTTTPTEYNGKGVPFSDDAERDLLACLLYQPSQLTQIERIVAPNDFFYGPHAIIFSHMISAAALGYSTDVRLLLRQIDEVGDFENIDGGIASGGTTAGGRAYINELALLGTGANNAIYFAEQVRAKSLQRKSMVLYDRASAKVKDGANPTEVQSWLQDEMQFLNSTGTANILPVRELIENHDQLRSPVIAGLLRQGETANIIAAAKMGKSWLAYSLALCVVTGSRWLDSFQCYAGRVLLIDNELHPEVLANRIPVVADALGIRAAEYRDSMDVSSLRGQSVDLFGVAQMLNRIPPDTYSLIIADAFYRFIPADTSENDNSQVMALYNTIDAISRRLGAAWINIHHASKGNQAGKTVTDVGSGAGAQSRAADTHLILRPHEQDGVVVLEAAVRSFAPVEPLSLRWAFPTWTPDGTIDPSKLKGNLTKQERRQKKNDDDGFTEILDAIVSKGPATSREVQRRTGLSRERADRLLNKLESAGNLATRSITAGGKTTREYSLPEG